MAKKKSSWQLKNKLILHIGRYTITSTTTNVW